MAVALPEEARAACDAAITGLRPAVAGAKWVPSENLHVTVQFLGRVDDARIGVLTDALAAGARDVGPIPTVLAGLGAFPTEGRARVLWAGLDDATEGFAALAAAVAAATEPLGFEPEHRPFRAHVTLARLRTPARVDLSRAPVEPVGFTVEEVILFESHLRRPAPLYEARARFPLAG